MPWYEINNIDEIDSPAMVVYPDHIRKNIDKMIETVGTPDRLWPHVKTHKMTEVAQMQLEKGITQFKCASIAEGEMLGSSMPSHGGTFAKLRL